METQDLNPRAVEELLEVEASQLLNRVVAPINRISERFAGLEEVDQATLRLPRVTSICGFRDMHGLLEKVRTPFDAMAVGCSVLEHGIVRITH